MIFVPPPHPQYEIRYRPSYEEVANDDISRYYRKTEAEMIGSREGSDYVRTTIAQLEGRRKLKQLSELRANWDSFGSEGPTAEAIRIAGDFINHLIAVGLIPDAILPSAEGGVAVCFVREGKNADVECLNSGEVLAVRYSRNERPHAWAVEQSPAGTEATVQILSAHLSR